MLAEVFRQIDAHDMLRMVATDGHRLAYAASDLDAPVEQRTIAFFGVRLYGYILSSIFSLPAYIGPYFIFAISGVAIALVLSFTLTTILVGREQTK